MKKIAKSTLFMHLVLILLTMQVVHSTPIQVASNQRLVEVFSIQKQPDSRFKNYPKYWIGQYNQEISVNFTQFDLKNVQGTYQLDGKVTAFKTTFQVTKLPHLYKIFVKDSNQPQGLLTFWVNVGEQTLSIDKSFTGESLKTLQFKLQSK